MQDTNNLLKAKIPCAETGIEIKKSLCAICNPDAHCAIDAYVKDGRLVKIEGNAGNVHAGGSLCAKGAANRQYVYNKERLMTPLRRVGEKGEGKFEEISWEEAYRIIAEKFSEYKAKNGAESVVFFSGFSKWFRPVLSRLCASFGSPNYCTESSTCSKATQMAWKLVFGSGSAPDFEHSKLLVVWTKNPLHTQSYQSRYILDAIDRGLKLLVIDPRNTPMSERAALHLKLKPGTDGALALGIANVMIKENIYDREFIEKYSLGFDEFAQYASEFTPKKTESITGVPAEKIIEAARLYALTKPACMMTSASPVVHHVNGVQNSRALISLVGLTGNFDIIGGNKITPFGYLHSSSFVKTNESQYYKPRVCHTEGVGEAKFPVWFDVVQEEGQSMEIPHQILSGSPNPIKAVLGFGLNHRMWPDSGHMERALKELDFFVNVELFMTDSCKYADIVLPACSSLERSELKVYHENFLYCSEPAIEPLGKSKHDIQILLDLAKALKIDDPMLNISYDEYMDYILEPTGVSLRELRSNRDGMYSKIIQPYSEKEYTRTGFKTPSGKMEFTSMVLAKYDGKYDILPKYRSAGEIYPLYSSTEYPFTMNTGARRPQLVHTRMYRIPWAEKLEPMNYADIHPGDAEKLSLQQNDEIKISTPKGSITCLANITIIGQEGVVFVYHGKNDMDVNSLMDKDYLDPISGFPGYKNYPCKIEKGGI